MYWLLEDNARLAIVDAYLARNTAEPVLAAVKEQAVSGGRAVIRVAGVLVDDIDRFAAFLGKQQTRYSDIISAINEANADPLVSGIDLKVSSPGGQATAQWLEAMKAIAGSAKPVTAYVDRMAASAAYGIASQATGGIIALNEMSQFGSIGVVTEIRKKSADDGYVTVTSDDAPNKVADPETEEGMATIKAKLNEIHAIFAERVTAGRKTTAEDVKNNFGKGAVFLAKEALSRGMIDSIGIETKTKKKGTAMTLAELKASEPALYEQAIALGVNQERERVKAHLECGEAAGAVDVAMAMIKDGAEHSGTTNAKYLAASMKKTVAKEQAEASDEADKALGDLPKGGVKPSHDDLLAKALDEGGEEWNG